MSGKPKTIEQLAKALGLSEKSLERMRRQYRMEHGQDADAKLLRWLEATWEEMRDQDDLFLRAGSLPSDLRGKTTNPRKPALGRGRTGMSRSPGKGRRRHLSKVVKPPTTAQIIEAAEQSAYVEFRDLLDAGDVPRSYQNVLAMQAHAKWAEHREQENSEAEAISKAKQLSKQIRDVALHLARSGVDPVPFLVNVQREISAERDRMRDAA